MQGLNLQTLDTANVILCVIQPSHSEQIEKDPEILMSHYTEISVSSSELVC